MSHHGWVSVSATTFTRGLQSPFGRLFPARSHSFSSHAIALLAGALGPLQTDTGSPLHNASKPKNPAGFTFLGQFVDHDLTEFRVVGPEFALILQNPTIEQRQRVLEDGNPTATNGRTGRLDLDSVYGLLGEPELKLFDNKGRFRMRENGGHGVDIIRNFDFRDGRLIADPRNDENKIIVQLHILFERLHNKLHDDAVNSEAETVRDAIKATRLRVVDIYRRIILFDYLPRVADPAVIVKVFQRLQENRSFYQQMNRRVRTALDPLLDDLIDSPVPGDGLPPNAAEVKDEILSSLVAMPVEFAHAAFRLGHSQLRDGYALKGSAPNIKGLPLFATGTSPTGETRDLRGNSFIDADIEIEWHHFFGSQAQDGEPLDASLPKSVFRLPPPAIGEPPVSLAERNIRRGVDFGLPSGQEAARILDTAYGNVAGLTPDQVLPDAVVAQYPELASIDASIAVITPLWFYILRESDVKAGGHSYLGKVGSYIVAETILGSLAATEGFDLPAMMTNYTTKIQTVQTTPATGEDDIFTMVHLLKFLGAPNF